MGRYKQQKAQKNQNHAIYMKSKAQINEIIQTEHGKKALMHLVTAASHSQLQKVHDDAVVHTTKCLTAAFLMSISDEFDFGKHRLERLLKRVSSTFDSVLKDYVSVQDIKDWCAEKGLDYEAIFVYKDGPEGH